MVSVVLSFVALTGLGGEAIAQQTAVGVAQEVDPIPVGAGPAAEWLRKHTDLDPRDVAFLGDGYILALTRGADGAFIVREEVSAQQYIARLGGRSAKGVVEFDCERGLTKIRSASVYGATGAGGEGQWLAPEAWLSASPDAVFDLRKAACDPHFRRPLVGRQDVSIPTSPAAASVSGVNRNRYWVQAGAFGSRALALAARRKIRNAFGADGVSIPIAVTEGGGDRGGKTIIRVVIGPFLRERAAQTACQRLHDLKRDCLIRQSP